MYKYNSEFYQYINSGSYKSAGIVIPELLRHLPISIQSVLDVGCGAGAWLSVWKENNSRVLGLDGDYVERASLLIDVGEFQAQDLTVPFDLGQRFDLAQSLEVAEHLPENVAAGFVSSLCRSSDVVLFSAAPPGQGGENHINEQPYTYWQRHFERENYLMYDPLRDSIAGNTSVQPWYRYNTFLFVRADSMPAVHSALAHCLVAAGVTPGDKSPVMYQLRKRLISMLSVQSRTRIAILKKNIQVGLRKVIPG